LIFVRVVIYNIMKAETKKALEDYANSKQNNFRKYKMKKIREYFVNRIGNPFDLFDKGDIIYAILVGILFALISIWVKL
jgi:hypothetical protein